MNQINRPKTATLFALCLSLGIGYVSAKENIEEINNSKTSDKNQTTEEVTKEQSILDLWLEIVLGAGGGGPCDACGAGKIKH